MPIVTMKELYVHAVEEKYILGAFNVFNFDTAKAVLEAAKEMQSPVILQLSMGARKYIGDYKTFIQCIKALGDGYEIPFSINHDHCPTVEAAFEAMESGVNGVMFDGSHLPLEENIKETKKVVEAALKCGIWVEAELGCLPGFEDEIFAEHAEFTDAKTAKYFVEATGCNALAVSAGTSHGGVDQKQNLPLHFEVLKEIHQMIPQIPLVLHGAASLPVSLIDAVNRQGGQVPYMKNCGEDSIKMSAQYGIRKANMDVDNFLMFTEAVRRYLNETPEKYDPRLYLKEGRGAFQKEVEWKFKNVTLSAGKNWWKKVEK